MALQKDNDWANAIALRIVDELTLKDDFPHDSELLRSILQKLFSENQWATKKLIGTGLIEKDYFEHLN